MKEAFANGYVRGAYVGLLALMLGLLAAEFARYAGLPKEWTIVIGLWATLAAFGAMRP